LNLSRLHHRRRFLIAASTTLVVFLLFLAIAQVERKTRLAQYSRHRDYAALEAGHRVEDALLTRFELLRQLKMTVEASDNPRAEFRKRSAGLQRHFAGFQAINWIDESGRIREIVPAEGNEAALGLDVAKIPGPREALLRTVSQGDIASSGLIELAQGGVGLATYIAANPKKGERGYINGVFRIRDFLHATLERGIDPSIQYRLEDDGGRGESIGGTSALGPSSRAPIRFDNQGWRLSTRWCEPPPMGPARLLFALGAVVALTLGVLTWNELTRRQEIETERRISAAILDASPDGVWLVDEKGKTLFANSELRELLAEEGSPEGLMPPSQIPGFDQLKHLQDQKEATTPPPRVVRDFRRRLAKGDHRYLRCRMLAVGDGDMNYVGTLLCVTDLTQQRLLEEQLGQAQRMEAVGRLAGGIAHQYNNLLTTIIGSAELLGDEDLAPRGQRNLDAIGSASGQVALLTQRLLAFSRRQKEATVDFCAAHRTKRLVQNHDPSRRPRQEAAPSVSITFDCDEGSTLVHAAAFEFDQALDALIKNAQMASPPGSCVRVHLRQALLLPGLDDLPAIAVDVEDRGCGIPDELRDRIFEPFFTTRPVGEGEGLGLAIVHGFVQRAGGRIEVSPRGGGGTRMRLLIPLAFADAEKKSAPAVNASALCRR
jgi:signal transduction histidine kinase/sensor domain CHASE-containing protein